MVEKMAEDKHEKEDAGPAPTAKNPLFLLVATVGSHCGLVFCLKMHYNVKVGVYFI